MSKLYVKQLLAGRDFGLNDPVAANMQNFVYLIGDAEHRECLIVDPAWAVEEIIGIAAKDDMKVVGALATHYHPDHIGGTMFGFTVEGLPKLLEVNPVPCTSTKPRPRASCR